MPSLFKLPILFLYALAVYFANSRAYTVVPEKKKAVKGLRELIVPHVRLITEVLTCGTVATEAILLLKQYRALPSTEPGVLYVTPLSVLGCIMAMIGAYFRYQAIATMGPMFTLAVTIQDNHKLVTHGPYSIVRHPAYTGAIIAFTGSMLYNFGPGSIMQAMTTWSPIMPYIQAISFTSLVWINVVFWFRAGVEDKLLKQQFGEEWESWAKKIEQWYYKRNDGTMHIDEGCQVAKFRYAAHVHKWGNKNYLAPAQATVAGKIGSCISATGFCIIFYPFVGWSTFNLGGANGRQKTKAVKHG